MKVLFAFVAAMNLTATKAAAQTCTVGATAAAFGSYNSFGGSATNGTGSLSVECRSPLSLLVSYTIQLGTGGSGTFSQRQMFSGGTGRLSYQFYRDITRTQIWGDGTGGTQLVSDGYVLSIQVPVLRTYTVYGRIPARQSIPPGVYNDVVGILLAY